MAKAEKLDPAAYGGPDRFDRFIGFASLLLLAAMLAAVVRGWAQVGQVPPVVWAHLATVGVALLLTPMLLFAPRGTSRHKLLGYGWVAAMLITALASLGIRMINQGQFSFIHIFSVLTLTQTPLLVWNARRGNHRGHRISVRAISIGALLVAGAFTLIPGRLLWHWLLG